jgi:hypothetical protein
MKSTDTALFTNSCGRVFPDRIQLASYKGEATIKMKEISSLSFKTSITRNGLLFALMPSVLIAASLLTNGKTEKIAFLAGGVLGIALLLYKAERKHVLRVYYKKGRPRDISVYSANIKEARKYVNEANKVVASYPAETKTPSEATGSVKGLATNY